MIKVQDVVTGFRTAEARWSRFGPYYAMFPVDFAFEVVEKYSRPGDFILDPFAGRSTSIYAGGVLGRHSLGIEINPVGWLYGNVKLNPADKEAVIDRLLEIYSRRNYYKRAAERMPEFYRMCYCDEVLTFLISARNNLLWKIDHVDATLMSILLVYLHGKLGEALSNQMRMSKAMGMNYSVQWWRKNKMNHPPEINPMSFIVEKLDWRYEKGRPNVFDSRVAFGDSTQKLTSIVQNARLNNIKFSLLFTSPPYYSVTNYYADQWLRLWLLGEEETPKPNPDKHKKRFDSQEEYYYLLDSVFESCSEVMAQRSAIYIRTDRREFSFNSTLEILTRHFPRHKFQVFDKPFQKRTQTEIHGNRSNATGEIDILLKRS